MSAVARLERALPPTPERGTPAAPARARALSPVAAPVRSRSLVPFVALCLSIIAGALVGVLLLNTTMAEGAYETRDLQIQLADLGEYRGELLTTLDSYAAPQRLARQAADLGMIPAPKVGFVSLEDGVVVGSKGKR